MRRDTLDPAKLRVLKLQAPVAQNRRFFLAGGTALGLRLGHRTSRDLDWFSTQPFDVGDLSREISSLKERPTNVQPGGAHTLRVYYGAVETSFIRYSQVPNPLLDDMVIDGVSVPVATVELIAIMKAGAVINRGSKRDFVDVYAICHQPGWSVSRFMESAAKRLPVPASEIARALSYFADAERDPMPDRCTLNWTDVKTFISSGVTDWQSKRP
jgi:hypothetical protein